MGVHLIITFDVKEEERPAFEQLMGQVKSTLPQVAGCQAVRIYNAKGDRCRFTLVETWESEAAHRAHVGRLVESGDWDRVRAHLKSDPVSDYFDML